MSTALIPVPATAGVPCAKAEHELFAAALAEHGNASAAYRYAYPQSTETPGSVRNSASRLAQHPDVRRRAAELEQQRRERILKSAEDLEAMVANLCAGKPAQLVDDDGHPIPLHLLPKEVQDAVKGLKLSVKRDSDGNTYSEYEVTFPDPLQAMRLLAQLRGSLVERHDLTTAGRALPAPAAHDTPDGVRERIRAAFQGHPQDGSDLV